MSAADKEAREFNTAYPVGTPVVVYPGFRPADDRHAQRIETVTRTEAWVLGGHTAVVMVRDHSSCIALSHIDPMIEEAAS